MHRGYISLWRKFKESDAWLKKRVFSEFEVWLDIITEARYQDEPDQVRIGKTLIECKRGQCIKSIKTWAERWGWTTSKVIRYFEAGEIANKIRRDSGGKTTILTVCNYERYNIRRRDIGEATGEISESKPETEEEGKERKKVNKETKNLKTLVITNDNDDQEESQNVNGSVSKNQVIAWWNEDVAKPNGLSTVRVMPNGRWVKFKLREKEGLWEQRDEISKAISESDHLKGNNNRGWKMNFKFLVTNDTNFIGIIEGQYKSKEKKPWE